MKHFNLIGAGRVGRTLARLVHEAALWQVQDVLTRNSRSAAEACDFIGAGTPVTGVDQLVGMRPADIWLIATPDDAILPCAIRLAHSRLLRDGDVVFHCSGALTASVLADARARGASTASMHPLKSFAAPDHAAQSFRGTYCAIEGDPAALALLKPAFAAIGARLVDIDASHKTHYHAASVIVCNNLVALMEAGLRCYEKAGLPRATASVMMEPLVRETVDNVFRLGTTGALTGPVARGDAGVVEKQLQALREDDMRLAAAYRALGVLALDLAHAQGSASAAALARLAALLCSNGG